jgi:hypothetical protein
LKISSIGHRAGIAISLVGFLAFWLGGFQVLIRSADWEQLRYMIERYPELQAKFGAPPYQVKPSIWGYSYSYVEQSSSITVNVEIAANGRQSTYKVKATRAGEKWTVDELKSVE